MLRSLAVTALMISLPTIAVSLMIPQVWLTCVKGKTAGLSAVAAWLGPSLSATWLGYGLLLRDPLQIGVNLASVGTQGAVLIVLLRHQPQLRTRTAVLRTLAIPAMLAATAAIIIGLSWSGYYSPAIAAATLGLAATGFSLVERVPQPWLLLAAYHRGQRTDVSGISTGRYWMGAVSSVLWIAYGVLHRQPVVCVSSVTALAATAMVLTYVALLRRRDDRQHILPHAVIPAQRSGSTALAVATSP